MNGANGVIKNGNSSKNNHNLVPALLLLITLVSDIGGTPTDDPAHNLVIGVRKRQQRNQKQDNWREPE